MGDGRRLEIKPPDLPTTTKKNSKIFFWGVGGSGSGKRPDFKNKIKI